MIAKNNILQFELSLLSYNITQTYLLFNPLNKVTRGNVFYAPAHSHQSTCPLLTWPLLWGLLWSQQPPPCVPGELPLSVVRPAASRHGVTGCFPPLHAIIAHGFRPSKDRGKNSPFMLLYTYVFTQTLGVSVLSHKTLTSKVLKVKTAYTTHCGLWKRGWT